MEKMEENCSKASEKTETKVQDTQDHIRKEAQAALIEISDAINQ